MSSTKPETREEFKQYCMRKLGHPVIQINLADEQVEDRITEALSFWGDYYYDGSELLYLKHQLTQEDIDNGYIEAPPDLKGVVRIFELNSSIGTGSGMFNVTYQFVLNNIQDISGFTIQHYYMTMQHLRFIQEMLVGWPMIRYNRHVNRIYIDVTSSKLVAGNYVIIEAYGSLESNPDIWSDRWLQNYATCLLREQWGYNLTKFSNMQLVGGVQFNGDQILAEARLERQKLEEEAIQGFQPIVHNFSG